MYRVLLFSLLLISVSVNGQVTINEIMSKNVTTTFDEDGDSSDWIELFNAGAASIDLTGWYLSDDASQPLKWQFESTQIEQGEFLLVYASSKDRLGPDELHTNFNISSSGESVLLSDSFGALISQTESLNLFNDQSYGASIDGESTNRVLFEVASPGATNAAGVELPFVYDQLQFSTLGGFYSDEFDLVVSSSMDKQIRYTLDGSEPIADSPVLTVAIFISDRVGQDDVISLQQTGFDWVSPKTKGEKATVVKAASFEGVQRVSPVYTESYFLSQRIQERYVGLPIISISVDADSLFDNDKGIYIIGDGNDSPNANYSQRGRAWEREVHIEYFDDSHQKIFGQNAGIRIHGNTSRGNSQKTLRLYARSEYGRPFFEYPFFDRLETQRFKRILLRSPSSDWGETMFRDDLCSELVSEMNVDYMETETCIVFINGEYWGVHSIRERIDEHYLSANHGVSADSLDLLTMNSIAENGDASAYDQLVMYIQTHDLSVQEHFNYVADQLDIQSFMVYNIAQLYYANFDWPWVNIRYWQGHETEEKWRWIFYDCDRCMALPAYDHLINVVYQDNQFNTTPGWTTAIFNGLLENQEFKEEFVQRFFFHLSTTFDADRVLNKIGEYEDVYGPLIVEHFNRWDYPSNVHTWSESVQEMRAFVLKRPAVMIQQLLDYLGEHYVLYPNPVHSSSSYVNLDMDYREGLNVTVNIYSSSGRLLSTINFADETDTDPQIPINDLSPGFYLVRIQYGVLSFTEKLIID